MQLPRLRSRLPCGRRIKPKLLGSAHRVRGRRWRPRRRRPPGGGHQRRQMAPHAAVMGSHLETELGLGAESPVLFPANLIVDWEDFDGKQCDSGRVAAGDDLQVPC